MDTNSIVDAAQRGDIVTIVNRGLAYAIMIAGFLSVIFIIVGGISFILSGGQEDKIKQAISTIRYSIIGLIITVLAVVIVWAVGGALGLDVVKYINFGDVVAIIKSIGDKLSSTSGNL
ncbi:hypothetical protein HZA39_00105 [Candidatus Peregrinibacteria bacterium]|nr:hypothetical protein [Candidatus Peregrinibacteria bacterium]